MFINLTNHASVNWSEKQRANAMEYGEIMDIPFPTIKPTSTSEEIDNLVNQYADMILSYGKPVVMLQGEYIFTYRLVNQLKRNGIQVLASCSERKTIETKGEDGVTIRKSIFEFVGFKEY